jgi:hypothetical protein
MRYLFFFFTQSRKNVFSSHIFVHLWLDVYPRFLIDFFKILNYIFISFLLLHILEHPSRAGPPKHFGTGRTKIVLYLAWPNILFGVHLQFPIHRGWHGAGNTNNAVWHIGFSQSCNRHTEQSALINTLGDRFASLWRRRFPCQLRRRVSSSLLHFPPRQKGASHSLQEILRTGLYAPVFGDK